MALRRFYRFWNALRMEGRMVFGLVLRRGTPWWFRLAAIAPILYVLSPVDLIPDVPFLGYIDDAAIMALTPKFWNWLMQRLPRELLDSIRRPPLKT